MGCYTYIATWTVAIFPQLLWYVRTYVCMYVCSYIELRGLHMASWQRNFQAFLFTEFILSLFDHLCLRQTGTATHQTPNGAIAPNPHSKTCAEHRYNYFVQNRHSYQVRCVQGLVAWPHQPPNPISDPAAARLRGLMLLLEAKYSEHRLNAYVGNA